MAFEHYIRAGRRLLRCGYTTGTCAALAAQGAARLLLTGQAPAAVTLVTPAGVTVEVIPRECRLLNAETALCAVEKDAGDDTDATDGLCIAATVRRAAAPGIVIEGGDGVGRVTKPGLDQPVGAAAINRVPRRMIEAEVRAVCAACGYTGGLAVVISVPGGTEAARRTFNSSLGIEGGISILGTSGIVEPMSERALIDTIELEQRQAAAAGADRLLLTPGNYGLDFVRAQGWDALGVPIVKCSNYIGEALDIAAGEHFSAVLLVGHIGKLVKLAGGVMDTHSRVADARAELFCAHAAVCGAGTEVCRALMAAPTADACLDILTRAGLRELVLQSLLAAIQRHLEARAAGAYRVGAALFSNQYGLLGVTVPAAALLQAWQEG